VQAAGSSARVDHRHLGATLDVPAPHSAALSSTERRRLSHSEVEARRPVRARFSDLGRQLAMTRTKSSERKCHPRMVAKGPPPPAWSSFLPHRPPAVHPAYPDLLEYRLERAECLATTTVGDPRCRRFPSSPSTTAPRSLPVQVEHQTTSWCPPRSAPRQECATLPPVGGQQIRREVRPWRTRST